MPADCSGRQTGLGPLVDLSGQHLTGGAVPGDRSGDQLLNDLRFLFDANAIIVSLACFACRTTIALHRHSPIDGPTRGNAQQKSPMPTRTLAPQALRH